jgi:ParB-like chromosome segregation protein Spo0J
MSSEINPRKITEEKRKKLIASLEKFNLAEIPAINFDNSIISGHQRIKALQISGRGEELIDVRVPDRQLTEKEVKEYMLISNTHAGDFDFELLDVHFSDVDVNLILDIETNKTDKVFKNPEKKEVKVFELTHVLISFRPEKLILISEYLEKIKQFDFIEYEQSSN